MRRHGATRVSVFFLIGAALAKFIRGKLLIPNNSGWDFFAC